ncbi:MAG: FAD-dependent oxidoreductase [Planctomycetota bacterium]
MIVDGPRDARTFRTERLSADLVIVGGGMAGVCGAITAARQGVRVVLVQDRPVLGGNAGSEVRLWILGATSHMGNNNRWAREGGVIDEILVENMYRNPEGNPVIFDTVVLEKVVNEPNITLLLNTSVYEVTKRDADRIASVRGFCAQNQTVYDLHAPLFCDASGDGVVGFLAGAAFRMGAESKDEFGEGFAPSERFGELLGHSIYFYTKDQGRPVEFIPPSFAKQNLDPHLKARNYKVDHHGCQLWWLEYGGRHDTIHDTERIKWELWSVVYGIWDHVKNSGEYTDVDTLTLEWVGLIPGKRESRRFEGPYILTQQDLVEQRTFDDAVSFGGWSLDLHPADGVYADGPGCVQYHSKGVYQIPYRCLFSRNISNLFLAGRIISASHVAFGSTRVMATCAHNAQAVAVAAAMCITRGARPADLIGPHAMRELQSRLLRTGQFIPGVSHTDTTDLMQVCDISASSELALSETKPSTDPLRLTHGAAVMLPVRSGERVDCELLADVEDTTELVLELFASERSNNHTPDLKLAEQRITLEAGTNRPIEAAFPNASMPHDGYAFIICRANENVLVHRSDVIIPGVLALTDRMNGRVATSNVQRPPDDSGIDTFELWRPDRRPKGHLLAMKSATPIAMFGPENVTNGVARPTSAPNAWVASPDDPHPVLYLRWDSDVTIGRIELSFDTDWDHPMESVLMGHPERVMPNCVRAFTVRCPGGLVVHRQANNHQTRVAIDFDKPIVTRGLVIEVEHPAPNAPAAVFEIRAYEQPGENRSLGSGASDQENLRLRSAAALECQS